MIYLTSVLHDPEGRLLELAMNNIGKIRFLFGCFTVVASEKTNLSLINLLKEKGVDVKLDSGSMPLAYRQALQEGVMKRLDHVFLVDFDRLLVWAERNFDELAVLKQKEYPDYTLVERSESAFRSHPETQLKTEYTMNYFLSKTFGFEEVKDFFSGAWLMSKEVAWHIVDNVKAENNGFYGEWQVLAFSKAANVSFIQCDGLEWETPYQYKREVEIMGLEEWKKHFDEKDKEYRVTNMYLILKEVMKFQDKNYNLIFS